MTGECFLIDWDLRCSSPTARRRFYRHLSKLIEENRGVVWWSSQSVLVVRDERLAIEIYRLALAYGKANLYRCMKMS